jgi:hypothetical protein
MIEGRRVKMVKRRRMGSAGLGWWGRCILKQDLIGNYGRELGISKGDIYAVEYQVSSIEDLLPRISGGC